MSWEEVEVFGGRTWAGGFPNLPGVHRKVLRAQTQRTASDAGGTLLHRLCWTTRRLLVLLWEPLVASLQLVSGSGCHLACTGGDLRLSSPNPDLSGVCAFILLS